MPYLCDSLRVIRSSAASNSQLWVLVTAMDWQNFYFRVLKVPEKKHVARIVHCPFACCCAQVAPIVKTHFLSEGFPEAAPFVALILK